LFYSFVYSKHNKRLAMTDHPASTKERILTIAGDIFGEKGYKATTIRAIAARARVNVAAVNYHFGDKESLYAAILEEVFHTGFTRFPGDMDLPPQASPQERLRAFVRAMFYRLQSREGWGGLAGRGRLIARELLAPSPAFETMLDRYIKPHRDLLLDIIAAIVAAPCPREQLLPCAISIIGQCIYYAVAAPVIGRISPNNAPCEENLDRLAEFVWVFSLGGIAAVKATIPAPKEIL
jgi:TetR/AcrR family transcriptional regulator, regulator of cefoperazone and chloramphenicol sensitivity